VAASKVVEAKAAGYSVLGDPRPAVTNYLTSHQINEGTYPSLPGRGGRNRGDGDDRGGGQFRPAGFDDGGQWFGRAMSTIRSLALAGFDPVLRDCAIGVPRLCVPPPVLGV